MGKRKQDNWQKLLDDVASDDGLPVRESGSWAEDKLFYWHYYLSITTSAMVGKPAWSGGVVYVDLFAGPGICVERKTGRRFPGSPLIAANTAKPFTKILLCDKDSTTADACRRRMEMSPARERYDLFEGDCNELIDDIVKQIPGRSLVLAFLDPTGLHLHFETVKKLAGRGATDLLILFPDAVDIIRNDKAYYFEQPESNLDLVLGKDSDWRNKIAALESTDASRRRKLYADIYKSQLENHCGYRFFEEEVITDASHRPLYRLIYATKHETGQQFWVKSVQKDSRGQGRLF